MNMKKMGIPGALWVAIVSLGIMALIHLVLALTAGSVALFTAAVWEAILVFGLIHGQKWAYVLVFVLSVLGVAVTVSKGLEQGLGALALNAIVVVPMVISSRYFFPMDQATPKSEQPERSQA